MKAAWILAVLLAPVAVTAHEPGEEGGHHFDNVDANHDGAISRAEADAKSGEAKEPDLRTLSEGLGYRSLAGFAGTGIPEAEDVVEALRKQGDLAGKYGRIGVGLATDDKGVPHWVIVLARK